MTESTKITRSELFRIYDNVICVGYGDLQSLLRFTPKPFYNAGVYGWNYSVYELNDTTAICTGYRPIGNIKSDYEFNRSIEQRAQQVSKWGVDLDEARAQLDLLKAELVAHYC